MGVERGMDGGKWDVSLNFCDGVVFFVAWGFQALVEVLLSVRVTSIANELADEVGAA